MRAAFTAGPVDHKALGAQVLGGQLSHIARLLDLLSRRQDRLRGQYLLYEGIGFQGAEKDLTTGCGFFTPFDYIRLSAAEPSYGAGQKAGGSNFLFAAL